MSESKPIRPLFKQFGSKWSAARAGIYPAPEFEVVVEHFAGSAGYALNHCDKSVRLFDVDKNIRELWKWLISADATSAAIKDIPVGLSAGVDIRTLGLSRGQKLLLKHWQRTNNVGECWTVSPWGNKPGQWTENTRARVADEVHAVKHWALLDEAPEFTADATHFVDPPYFDNYAYRQPVIDHAKLGHRCLAGQGQIIVCEGLGKGGTAPTWLPFRECGQRVTSRRKAAESHHRMEYIWTKDVSGSVAGTEGQ